MDILDPEIRRHPPWITAPPKLLMPWKRRVDSIRNHSKKKKSLLIETGKSPGVQPLFLKVTSGRRVTELIKLHT